MEYKLNSKHKLKENIVFMLLCLKFLSKGKSRFCDYFEKLKVKQENQIKKKEIKQKRENGVKIKVEDIISGIDKRTSLMIKNIPINMTKMEVINFILSIVKINYIYAPENEETHKILGYAFINVYNNIDIIHLLNKLTIINVNIKKNFINYINTSNNCVINNIKNIEICYFSKQGLKALKKTFEDPEII